MRTYRGVVVVFSFAFLLFSAVFGARYDKLRKDDWNIGYDPYSTPAQAAQERAKSARVEAAQERIHSIVKPVSLAYYLLLLGFFVRAWRVSPWRKVAILGGVASLFMTAWSMIVSRGASFDEVYPAWIVAALVLPALSLVVLPAASAEVKAAP